MKKKFENAKTFVKEHKTEILIGTGLLITSGVLFVVTKKKPKFDGTLKIPVSDFTMLDVPDSLLVKGVEEVSSYKPEKLMDIWAANIPLSELGNIGKELCETYGWKPEQTVRGVVTTYFEEN